MYVGDGGGTTATAVMADVDVSFLGDIRPRLGWEFGVHAGVGVCLFGRDGGDNVSGFVTPTVSVFTGFRF